MPSRSCPRRRSPCRCRHGPRWPLQRRVSRSPLAVQRCRAAGSRGSRCCRSACPQCAVPPHGSARVVVLDVGHGLAVLVETRNARLLFDAGPTAPSGFDSGEEIVLPALAASGRRGLDRLIVSHADNDHAGGAAAVVAAFPQRRRAQRPGRRRAAGACLCARSTVGMGRRALHDPASRRRLRRARQRELVRAQDRGRCELVARHRRHRAARRERRSDAVRSTRTSSSCRITAAQRRRRRRSLPPSVRSTRSFPPATRTAGDSRAPKFASVGSKAVPS